MNEVLREKAIDKLRKDGQINVTEFLKENGIERINDLVKWAEILSSIADMIEVQKNPRDPVIKLKGGA